MNVQHFFLSYLLLPLIAVVATAGLAFMSSKSKFINNRKLIVSILVLSILLAFPGVLGLLGMQFMPWGYIISQLYYLVVGCFAVYLMTKYYSHELLAYKLFLWIALLISFLLSVYLYRI